MNKSIIQVQNLSKMYRISHKPRGYQTIRDQILQLPSKLLGKVKDNREEFWALKDVSFEIEQGDRVGIIGRNGAGKSTLLKLLSRITKPTSGRATINGRVASLLEVGTGFHPELTGRENIFMNGALLGMSHKEIKSKFDEIVDFAEVEKFIDTPVKRYSSGMYVRLAFSVAAHLEPEILLVDEVLAVGDAQFQKKCLGKMENVSKEQGRTVILVSHNMSTIEYLCSAAILLDKGSLKKYSDVKEVISSYLSDDKTRTENKLVHIDNRKGDGNIRFSKIDLVDNKNNYIEYGQSGSMLKFRLSYTVVISGIYKNCRISLLIKNNAFESLLLLSTELTSDDELIIKNNGYIDFIVDKLPLSQGNYFVTLFIEANKIVEDWLTDVFTFQVEDGDFYGKGKNYPQYWGGKTVLVKHSWVKYD